MQAVATLVDRWRQDAEQLRHRYRDERTAAIFEERAAELEQALDDANGEPLTLQEAAGASGYSGDHLRRLLREGKLPNVGRKHAPRIRRGDLPTKAGHLPGVTPSLHLFGRSKEQIARSIVNQS